MTHSTLYIDDGQDLWAGERTRDSRWRSYLARVGDNLFLNGLLPETEADFRNGDGSELTDGRTRPAKMRALASSSALAVNFFDAWRKSDMGALARAIGFSSSIVDLRFEFKTRRYPVRPRSPNLDLMLVLSDGQRVAIEAKFAEPYRTSDGLGLLSSRYFPPAASLWTLADLPRAQQLADRLRPEWQYLDVPQLLKHLLGLANDPHKPEMLLYLWFDTGKSDAVTHRAELERFTKDVSGDAVTFGSATYQEIFRTLKESEEPAPGWYRYMAKRYFATTHTD